MKKILSVFAATLLLASLLAFTGCDSSAKTTLNVYNWGEYMPDGSEDTMDVIAAFEEKYPDIKVNYTTFESNEALYAKLKSGASDYDVIIPSDYMIARLIEEDMLQPLDFDNISNFENINEDFVNPEYDPTGEYSVPYAWGTVGLIYNTTMVDEAPTSWDALWDEQYENSILMFNNSRDAFGIAAKLLGYSQNTTNETEIRAIADKLTEQKPLVQAYVMDEIFDKMENGEAALAPYYAGDAVTMMDENEDLAFVLPEEGSNRFVDAMCVPSTSENKEAAELFINFILEADVGAEICDYLGYSTPNDAAYELLDTDVKENSIIYPDDATLEKCEFFLHLPEETNQLMQDLWVEIKTS